MAGTWNRSRQLLTAPLPVNPHKSKRMLRLFTLEDRQAPGDLAMSTIFGPALALGGMNDELFSSVHRSGHISWLMPVEDSTHQPAPRIGVGDLELQQAVEPTAFRRNTGRIEQATRTVQLEEEFGDTFGVRKDRDLLLISVSLDSTLDNTNSRSQGGVEQSPTWPTFTDVQEFMASSVHLPQAASSQQAATATFGTTALRPVEMPTQSPLSDNLTPVQESTTSVSEPITYTFTSDDSNTTTTSSEHPDRQIHLDRFVERVSINRGTSRTESDPFTKTTHHYIADGEAVGMNIHPDRIAIGTTLGAAEFEEYGLRFVRPVNEEVAIYEAPGAGAEGSRLSFEAIEGVQFTVPVFSLPETQSEAVLIRDVIVALEPGVTPESYFTNHPDFVSYRPLLGTPDQFVGTVVAGYGEAALEVANSLDQDPRVAWASPDFYQNWQRFYIPNDPRFGNQWHLHNTGQGGGLIDADSDLPEAWDVNQGGSSTIVVAVVDDGVVTNHPDILNWVNPGETAGDFFDNDGNGWTDDINGWNFVSNNNDAGNSNVNDAHGTAVAGVAAARGDNGVGVTGAAYNSRVMSVRIFNGGAATSDSNIASALYYAGGRTANGLGTWKSADVVNNSWGGGGVSTAINGALSWGTVNGRQGQGTTFFFATGNGYSSIVSQPAAQSANIPGVIAVGATNNKGTRSDYSNYGTAVDIVAPSNDLRSGYLAIDTTDRPGTAGYNTAPGTAGDYTGTGATGFGGTSSATPLASGIGALVLDQANKMSVSLTPAQLRSYLRTTTDLIGGVEYNLTTGHNLEYGYGRLNAFTAVSGVGKPEISLVTATTELTSGSSIVSLADTVLGSSTELTFRVRNQGTQPLSLNDLSVASGPFTISAPLGKTTLNLGESTTFTAKFVPTSGGVTDRVLTLTNSDADEGTFTITLRGTGLVPSVAGRVFEDWNGDGVRAPGDPGLAAQTVFIDNNSNGILDSKTATFSNPAGIPIPDNNTKTYSDIVVSGASGFIFDLDVKLSINHSRNEDLDVFLVAPDGTRVELFTDVGGTSQNFVNTVLDDQAALSITAGVAPFTGYFKPEGLLSNFNGLSPNGTWRLEVSDDTVGETGTIVRWSINLSTDGATGSNLTTFPIPTDGSFVFSDITVAGATGQITDVNVKVNVTHPWIADAELYLISPEGKVVHLVGNVGGSGDNFVNTVFDDAAGKSITSGTAPFTGSFRPLQPLSTLNGGIPNGIWTLAAYDNFPTADHGTLNNWEITLTTGKVAINPPPLAIPDNNTKVYSDITVAGFNAPIADVNVKLNISHTWVEDLDVFLVGPDGTRVELFTDVGGGGQNFVNTVLDDQAGISIVDGLAPFTGSYRPEGKLSDFNGKDANGIWRLELADDTPADAGTLDDWSITIFAQEPTTKSDVNGDYSFLSLPNGSYTIRQVVPANWNGTGSSSHSFTITDPNDSFTDRHFGLAKNNRFYGFVFADANANGSHDGGELPLANRTLFVDTNSNGKFDAPTMDTFSSGTIAVGIPDNTTVTSKFTVSGVTYPIPDINVRVNLTHTWVGDLWIDVISPAGTRVNLFNRRGGSGDNLVNTIFDDEAATAISAGSAPFTGSFRPEQLLSAIDGQSANGTWTLEIRDNAGGDTGTLTEWAVIFSTPGEQNASTNSHGQAYFDLAPGSHSIGLVGTTGWNYTNPASGFLSVNASGAPLFQQSFGTIDTPAPALNDVLVNGSTAPAATKSFSRVDALELTFNTSVTVQNGAFSLSNGTTTLTNTLGGGISVAVAGNKATLTFTGSSGVDFGSLADGIWTLTTDMTKVSNSSSVAGTGTAVTNHIRRLYGDIDFNGVVSLTDFAEFGNTFGLSTGDVGFNAQLDFDNNGVISLTDFAEFGNRFGSSLE